MGSWNSDSESYIWIGPNLKYMLPARPNGRPLPKAYYADFDDELPDPPRDVKPLPAREARKEEERKANEQKLEAVAEEELQDMEVDTEDTTTTTDAGAGAPSDALPQTQPIDGPPPKKRMRME